MLRSNPILQDHDVQELPTSDASTPIQSSPEHDVSMVNIYLIMKVKESVTSL